MCFLVDGQCEVYEQTIRKARKPHKCRACRREIKIGEQYLSTFSVFEGEADTTTVCNQCAQDAVVIHRHEILAGCEADWDTSTWAPWDEVFSAIREGNPDERWIEEFDGDEFGDDFGRVLFWPYDVPPATRPVDLRLIPEYAN